MTDSRGSEAGAPGKKNGRRKLAVVLTSSIGGVVVLALVAFLAVQWIRPAASDDAEVVQLAQLRATAPSKDSAYKYTKTFEDMSPAFSFQIPMNFDFYQRLTELAQQRAGTKQKGPVYPDPTLAMRVFSDAALTLPVDAVVGPLTKGAPITVASAESTMAGKVRIRPGRLNDHVWGLHHDYYLVRYLSQSGAVLAKPIVTHFSVDNGLDEPRVTTTVSANGTIQLHWRPVKGAKKYLVVTKAESTISGVLTDPAVVATTSGTTWNDAATQTDQQAVIAQNLGFTAGSSADMAQDGPATDVSTDYQFGVIATDGTRYSGWQSQSTAGVLGGLPSRFADNAASKVFPSENFASSLDLLPTVFPYTSIDGTTRQGAPQILTSTIEPDGAAHPGQFVFFLGAAGTGLTSLFTASYPGGVAAFTSAADAYNQRMLASQPTTGTTVFNYAAEAVSGSDYDENHPSTTAPATKYPISGSGPMVKYLAANLIAHKGSISLAAYVDRPGAPDVQNAVEEAVYQNPYVLGFTGFTTGPKKDSILVDYGYSADHTAQLQQQLYDKVQSMAAGVSGLSDAQKVMRINDQLAAMATYNTAAYQDLQATKEVATRFLSSQDATGVLLDGTGVCTSYAKAFAAVARAEGLNAVVVTGTIDSDGAGHAWNKVQVNGAWKDVDVTWDDSPAGNLYLMIPDSGFTGPAARAQDDDWMDPAYIPQYAAN